MPNIQNIIFDLGGVVVDLDIPSCLAAFAPLITAPVGSQEEAIQSLRPLMHAMDAGEMDGQTFVNTIKPTCRPGVTDGQIVEAFNSIIRLHRHRLEWLKQLRERYRVYLLSNIGDLHWTETRRQAQEMGIRMDDCFDKMFLSYQLRMTKPDTKIFEHVIQAADIRPEETLYIDDLPENIEAGRHLGLRAHKIMMNTIDTELPALFPELKKI